MSEVYAARLVAKKHIVEQCTECNVKKNSNGLYNHDDIVKVKETIEGKLNEVFLDHTSGLTMKDLLATIDNEINNVTTTQMVTADALIAQAKKDAAVADAAAKKVAKTLGTEAVDTIIMTREEAKREAERQNIANQTIVGTKEGLIEVLKRLIGGAILDPVTKIADGSRDKSIDAYKLHEVFQLAFDNAVRPEVDDVLDLLIEMYQYDFDFRLPIKHSMAQLKTMATKLKPFGITPGDPELMLVLLANIHFAKEQAWGHEFRAAMAAIRKQYTYDHVHDVASTKFILKELAGADELRNMKLAPAPNVNKANAVQKYKSILEDASSCGNSSLADSSMSSYAYGSEFDSSQEECMRVVEQQERRDRKERKEKKEKKRTSSKKSSAAASSDTSSDDEVLPLTCKYCIKFSKSQHPPHITPETCMWNKKVRKFRYNSVCRKMKLKFIEGGKFTTGEEDTWPKHKKLEGKKDD
jgi:esterase/lipase